MILGNTMVGILKFFFSSSSFGDRLFGGREKKKNKRKKKVVLNYGSCGNLYVRGHLSF